MVDIRHRACQAPGCSTRPSFNYPSEVASVRCCAHRLPGMIATRQAPRTAKPGPREAPSATAGGPRAGDDTAAGTGSAAGSGSDPEADAAEGGDSEADTEVDPGSDSGPDSPRFGPGLGNSRDLESDFSYSHCGLGTGYGVYGLGVPEDLEAAVNRWLFTATQ